jgi:integrase/recombinase XerD
MNTLREAVHDYVEMRQSLGFKLHDAERRLLKFVSFLEERHASHITVGLALQWAQENPLARPAEWGRRLCDVRGFARYRSASDPRTEIPNWGLLPFRRQRLKPYLYSEDEIRLLLDATLEMPSLRGLRGETYRCLLGLLAVTGLRISEAVNLRSEDVDLTAGVLTVRRSKFRKSRLVPIHPSTVTVLSDYASQRKRFLAGRLAPFFFISRRGTRLIFSCVRVTFYAISRRVGLRAPFASHGPRLHDFRHRFAVQTLLHWYRSGQDVERRLPVLSTYLGHAHVSDTYWYFTAYPELMGLAVKRLDEHWGNRV